MASNARGSSPIEGVLRPTCHHSSDVRGSFTKVWDTQKVPADFSGDFRVMEMFWTRSNFGVIRGMHLQVQPFAGAKLVWVTEGTVVDVVLDLRPSSPTLGHWNSFRLDWMSAPVFIPEGCAHGFEVLSSSATVNYAQACPHRPSADTGVRWDSFGYEWQTQKPLISPRDLSLPPFELFMQGREDAPLH